MCLLYIINKGQFSYWLVYSSNFSLFLSFSYYLHYQESLKADFRGLFSSVFCPFDLYIKLLENGSELFFFDKSYAPRCRFLTVFEA